ncbi:hypothetical protein [Singulisphaera sp. PoT]|uniref:hypothetical protein n=1 Tax=Singulisphaera sp. PoT TaxID=3411797 RepID=UPI003BF5BA48
MRCYQLTDFIGATTLIELTGNAVFDAFQEQFGGKHDPIDLVPLWNASKRKRNYSPRRLAKEGMIEVLETFGDRPDDPILADPENAWEYAYLLDDNIKEAIIKSMVEARKADPVGQLLGSPNLLMAAPILMGVMNDEGLERDAAVAKIMREVLERTEHLDEMERETIVARIQRGLAAVQVLEVGAG